MRRIAPVLAVVLAATGLTVAYGTRGARASVAPPAPAPSAMATATVVAAPSGDAVERARKLALAPSKDGTPVDLLIEQSQKAIEKNPKKVDWWIVLGRAWVRKARESSDPGYYLNATAAVDVALDLSPDNTAALDVKGLALLNDHKFEEARELAERTVAKNAEDPTAFGTLSDALLELGRYDEATKAAQTMMDLKPNLPSYSRAAHLAWLHGDVGGAKESLRLALDSGKDQRDKEPYAWVLAQAAQLFLAQGDLEGAEAGFDRALEWLPGFAPANVGKGRVALARHQSTRAAELFQRAYATSPLVETAWLLGDAREAAGDVAGAKEARDFVRKEGRRTDPRTLAAFLAAKNETPEDALALADGEMKVRPDMVTEDVRAWALYRLGRVQDARSAIVHARRLGTKDARMMYHEGAIRLAMADKTEQAEGRKLLLAALGTGALDAFGVGLSDQARKLADQ